MPSLGPPIFIIILSILTTIPFTLLTTIQWFIVIAFQFLLWPQLT